MNKTKKDFWEKLLKYPSFNTRFGFILVTIIGVLSFISYYIVFERHFIEKISDQIAFFNLVVQSATLILGIFAAYYALRQLVETRFTGLDEAGNQELKRKHYSRAIDKWKEAFYIRPETPIFNNLCETLLIISDYETFDNYMKIIKDPALFSQNIFIEKSDQVIMLYLKSVRNLLVKNQGEAEKYITEIIDLTQNDIQSTTQWDFLDLQTSVSYQDLTGECKKISENLILYLQQKMLPDRKKEFESKNFTSDIES